MAKQFPTTTSTAAPATADYLLFSDSSDSDEIKKVTIDDFLKTPTDNTFQLGDATHGYKALYITDGSTRAAMYIDGSDDLMIGTSTNDVIHFVQNGAKVLRMGASYIRPVNSDGGVTLGSAPTDYGFGALYLSDGTRQGNLDLSGGYVRFGSTSDHDLAFRRQGNHICCVGAGSFWAATSGIDLGKDTVDSWNNLYLGDGGTGQLNITLSTHGAIDLIGGGNLAIKRAGTSRISLESGGTFFYDADVCGAPNGTLTLGNGSYGWAALYVSVGAAKGWIGFDSGIMEVGTTSANSLRIQYNSGNVMLCDGGSVWFYDNPLPSSDAGNDLGSSSYGWGALYMSDGTATFEMSYTGNQMYLESTSTHTFRLQNNGYYFGINSGTDTFTMGTAADAWTWELQSGYIVFKADTSDAGDDQCAIFCGGGGISSSGARGAELRVYGNEYGGNEGRCDIKGGDHASGSVNISTYHASAQIQLTTAGAPVKITDGTDAFYLTPGTNTLEIKGASTDHRVSIVGAYSGSTSYSSYIVSVGNDYGGVGAGGQIWLYAGNESTADIVLKTSHADTGIIQSTPAAAIASGRLLLNTAQFYLDETGNNLMVQIKESGGGTYTGTVCSYS